MIGAPLSCPSGHLEVISQAYSYKPGQHGRVTNIHCLLANGERETITFITILYAGLVYSAVLMTTFLWLGRSEEHTSALQSLMRISYAVFCLKKKKDKN